MYYYKFRVYHDEVEDFVRDIEILSSDSFESLHNILYSSIGLNGNELASFSICDTKWNKQKEITLIDMGDDTIANTPEYDEEDGFTTKSNIPKFVMKDAVIKDFIIDPHQYIIYEYDFLKPKIFYLELLKTLTTDSPDQFPKCTHSVKSLPKEVTPILNKSSEEELLEDFQDEDFSDDLDVFEDGLNEEDHIGLDTFDDIREF